MNEPVNPTTSRQRVLIESLDLEFGSLHERSCLIIKQTPADILYQRPSETSPLSVGENVLRSAAAVEQTFGGLMSNLWDDPFEWTLPETLSTCERVLEYLEEVASTRKRAFSGFSSDAELSKNIVLPSDKIQPLISVLVETLVRASHYQGRAVASLKFLSDVRVRGVII
ncbi:MAG: hypothetical protein ACRD6N_08980 [Pyrinomonadaceae bacterium]